MANYLRMLMVDASSGFYRVARYKVGDFFGPVDLGLHLSRRYNSLNIGVGLLAGSLFNGSNRLIFNGNSPCWGGFYISAMGGAGLVFDNLGINMVSLVGKSPSPAVLYLNRVHGEEIEVEVLPLDLYRVWRHGRGGIYGVMEHILERLGDRYETDPRILAVGPAARTTDFGAIGSAPIKDGKLSFVDTWAGRGGFGTKMLQDHGIAAIVYGGTFVHEDFRDRTVADQWFQDKYQMKMSAKAVEATTKYRFEGKFNTGGTFGVNYATLGGRILFLNYQSMYLQEEERLDVHQRLIVDHYLKQFNEETIDPKQQQTCGEPCVAVCKKMRGEFKKDYEPYQTMGPLAGIFDQRAAEKINHHADRLGFDAISAGGIISWLMECLDEGVLSPEELGVAERPVFSLRDFDVLDDSLHNAELGIDLLDGIVEKRGILDLQQGARKLARQLSREKGKEVLDRFPYCAFARNGWMIPNQYWTPGALSPMAIMGKYYMYYGNDFLPPRELGKKNAERLKQELLLDNLGFCRFHRAWAEDMIPDIMGSLFDLKDEYLNKIALTASRISSRNASVFWESERAVDLVYTFLKRKETVEGIDEPVLRRWVDLFEQDRKEAALGFWYEMHKGIQESLREF